MRRWLIGCAAWLAALGMPVAQAAVNVFACEPEWAALATELGGERVDVYSATTALQDPHRIEARPSLIAKLRRADLLVCTGGGLEEGWLPVLLRQSGNARVQPGAGAHFKAVDHVDLLNVPDHVDRSMGHVHAAGNPHVHLDPRRVARIADALAERLIAIDSGNATFYRERHADFADRWRAALQRWEKAAAPLRDAAVITHHQDWVYFADWLGLRGIATLEPLPGLPPTVSHLAGLEKVVTGRDVLAILRTPYQDARGSEWLHRRTGIPMVVLPYTVGGVPQAEDLFGLFDESLRLLLEVNE